MKCVTSVFSIAAGLLVVLHLCASTPSPYEVTSLSHSQRRSTVNITVDFSVPLGHSSMPDHRGRLCDVIRQQVEETMAIDGRFGFVANSTVVDWVNAPSTLSMVVLVTRGVNRALNQGTLVAALAEVDYKAASATLVDLRYIRMLRLRRRG
jgi:hypothetical protein